MEVEGFVQYSLPYVFKQQMATTVAAEIDAQARKSLEARYKKPLLHPLALQVCCGFLLRAVVVMLVFRSVASPLHGYGDFGGEMGWVARSIATGHGFSSPFLPDTGPTALVPPLYVYLLAGVFKIFGLYTAKAAAAILLLDSLLSALTCIPIYYTLRYSHGERVAALASWIWVVYPFAINFSAAEVWDYALTALLFAACFCFAQRLHVRRGLLPWAGFGALSGVTVLSNPSILSLLPFLLLCSFWKARQGLSRWMLRGTVALIVFLAVLAPWLIRNHRAMHADVAIRDGLWLEVWAGNAGDSSTSNPAWAHPATNPAEMRLFQAQGEVNYLAGKKVLSEEAIRRNPGEFVRLCLRRALRFWTGFWSFSADYRKAQPLDMPNLFFCSVVTLLMLRGAWRYWGRNRDAVLPYLALLVVFPLPYYVTHSSMDYREPIEPEIVMMVAMGLDGRTAGKVPASRNRILSVAGV